eukprot:5239028-Prymnesium_polylepis.1
MVRYLMWNWHNASERYAECAARFDQLTAEAAAANSSCAELPPPCNGHGQCIDGQCVCDVGTHGGQCEAAPNCSFWDYGRQSWSGEGCRLARQPGSQGTPGALLLFPESMDNGTLVCECDHLTDFGVLFGEIIFDQSTYSEDVFSRVLSLSFPTINIFTDPGKFFETLGNMSGGQW